MGIRLLAASLLWACASGSWAQESFEIEEIKAEGLVRLEIGTVLTYLPLSVGDILDEQTARQSIRALYGSGLFQDVQLLADGKTLVIKVEERPAITSFEIEGNDKIGGDELLESLKNVGLAEGELFKRALLDQVEQELRRQYYANGFYDVEITTNVVPQINNRVQIKIDVVEGKVTKIKSINVVGNTIYDDETLLEQLELESTDWVPFQKTDRYSKQHLQGDLESLASYYQDRGYLQFDIASVQVALSPDKKDIYITLNVTEGEVYTVADRRFSGDIKLNEAYLNAVTTTRAGDKFSRREATESANRIEAALSDIGYAFAEVTPLPEINEEKREVTLNYFIEPGKRAYVRRINFSGHAGTNDETLRREMRQLEASPFSKSAIERSRVRLARLPFIEEAEVETAPVPGTDDLVDVNFSLKERPPGSVQVGVGFSASQGFLVTGSLTHSNFLGTGNRVSFSVDNNSISRSLNLSWTDPYFTEDGISQTVSTFFRKSEGVIRFSSGFSSNVIGANLTYGLPLSEFSALRIGAGVQETAIETFANNTADEVLQFVVANGSRYTIYQLRTGISRDTRNRTIFASRGSLHQYNLDIAVPGSDIEYFSSVYTGQQYVPIYKKFFAEVNASVAFADGYGQTNEIPPFERFFAGGPRTVRGFREGTLGPRDSFTNPFGGKLRTSAQVEFVIPLPFEADSRSTRFAAFFDIGNAFREPSDFEYESLRQSYGLAFRWFTPFLGILNMSYAIPLNDEPIDEVDRFQITFGSGF